MWHVQVFCLVWDDTYNMRLRNWSKCWKMVPPNETSRQPLALPRAWCPGLEPVPGNWWLRQTSRPRTLTMHDHSPRPLHPPNGCTSPSQCPPPPPPEHSSGWTSCKPHDIESVTKLCAIDSMRTAFTADGQNVAQLSPEYSVELDLTLPRIINIGIIVIDVPFSSTCEGMETGRWMVCWQQHRRIRPIRRHLSGRTNGPGGHWWRGVISCAVSRWSPWTDGTTLCRGFRSGFCPDARQCPTSHGQSRPSLPGAGRHRRD